ncbi:MAG: hypothetical protein R6X33_07015 [Candidatus Brocadiia bacterium]
MGAKEAELIRKKYLYRRLILRRRVCLSRQGAVRLIGPDCAYHLYSRLEAGADGDDGATSR